MTVTDARLVLLREWLTRDLSWAAERIEPASSDASFRRYFRAFRAGETRIVMDAPPDKEDVRPYLEITRLLGQIGVHVPQVHAADATRGLVLLEDLGSTSYLQRLEAGDDPDKLYGDALAALADVQVRGVQAAQQLAPYDRAALAREVGLMPEWFCRRHLELTLTAEDEGLLAETFDFLIDEALDQPAVFVHRDFHSRNLMVTADRNPGVIDFQDALRGPIGYDLVSLLEDCYIDWPRTRVESWVTEYRGLLKRRGAPVGQSDAQFLRWFDLVGLQRHLKVLGIFARLWYRDGKPGYLKDLPLVLDYVRRTCALHPQLAAFGGWLDRRVLPEFAAANSRALAASS